ncbi:hypothetical protein E4T38_02804 [Aureobasidium subglaciale]|nr:hypothetical protein E4T38_02804 [Aureobasidium subglaciale]KAI5227279.1 hypothetical protein E4T40_02756 [Aureobasidium subglaciale]
MAPPTRSAPLLRLAVALTIFIIGICVLNGLDHPRTLAHELSTILSNQTLTLQLSEHDDTGIAAVYVPASLKDNGRTSIFWGGLFALGTAGAYIYGKIQDHIFSQLYALDKDAKDVPKGEKLRFHLQGVRNLDLTGWLVTTGPKDTFMAWTFSVCSMAGVLYIAVLTAVQAVTNDIVVDQLRQFLNNGETTNNTVFGSSIDHGSYTLESWTCQTKSLLATSVNSRTTAQVAGALKKSCHDGRKTRYLLQKPAWMAIPLENDDGEDDDSEEDDDDPMARFGSNAREQWLLEEG